MFKKITTGLLLTILVLAFPTRLLGLSDNMEAILKIVKGLLFITIIFYLMNQENFLRSNVVLKKIQVNIFLKLVPVQIVVTLYVVYFWDKNIVYYHGSLLLLILTLAGTLIAAFAEEIIFRGYILNLLKRNGYTFFKSIVLSSLFFSLTHIINIFRYEDAWAILNQVFFAFALGMLLGSIYALTNNLLVVCILHFIINLPSSVRRIIETNNIEEALVQNSFFENLFSTLFYMILMLPVLILALYYMKLVEKKNNTTIINGHFSKT